MAFQILLRRLQRRLFRKAIDGLHDPAHRLRRYHRHDVPVEPVRGAFDVMEIFADRLLFRGECFHEHALEIRPALWHLHGQAGINKHIVNIGQGRPVHAAIGDEIEQPSPGHAWSHFAHVMNADIPGPAARPAEGVRKSANFEMAFENEDAPLPQLGHDAGKSERAHAGADDDGVVGMLVGVSFFGSATLRHENLPRESMWTLATL